MATITENLQTIKDSTMAIKQAIIDKGGEVGDLTTYATAITNLLIGGGGGSTSSNKGDVTFYDYDGTILHSFSKDEFLALNELPSLPTQPGLICQEWNYDITIAKTYVEEYGKLDIGATYITDDGKTRLYIKIAAEGRMTVPLYFSQTVDNGVIIDWGDGSDTQSLSGTGNLNTSHTYASIGDYCITLTVTSGCTLGLGNNSSSYCVMGVLEDNWVVYCNMLQKVEIGSDVISIGKYAFKDCTSLSSVVIPSNVTSIGSTAFFDCYSLCSLVIPSSVTSIEGNTFPQCYSLSSVVIPSSVTSIGGSMFNRCYSLSSVVIPSSVTSIGGSAFHYCYSLSSVVIPSSVTSIGASAFHNCYSLSSVVIPSSVTTIGGNAFNSCYSLSSVVIPPKVTFIGYQAFQYCYSLSSVEIPSSVTSISTAMFQYCYSLSSVEIPSSVINITNYAFEYCYSLRSVVIPPKVTTIGISAFHSCTSLSSVVFPSSVTSIGDGAFNQCNGVAYYDFSNHTRVPTLSNTTVFIPKPSDGIIVPDSLYEEWIVATNWSVYASKIIKKSDWDAL